MVAKREARGLQQWPGDRRPSNLHPDQFQPGRICVAARVPAGPAGLLPVVLVGHLAGSWAFRRMPTHRYDQLLLAVAAAGAVSIVSGLR